ncbi:MAG: hypothetical protein L0J38_00690 [Corynebacterium casei]|nr:hypothetical protein [Corynebacterium casei]
MASALAALILVPIAIAAPTAPAWAQDTACAVPLGSAESPSFSPAQQDYRARLHSLATGKGIKVAIIDTGVSAHEQFPQLEAGPDSWCPIRLRPFMIAIFTARWLPASLARGTWASRPMPR